MVELSIVEANRDSSGEELEANEHHHAIDDVSSPKQLTSGRHEPARRFASRQMQTSTACDLNQRSLMAHERSQLCYWFHIGEALRMKINGSLASAEPANSLERLLEAELHVFKLLPEMLAEQMVAIGASEVDLKWKRLRPTSQDAPIDVSPSSSSKSKTTQQTVQKSNINRGHTNRLMVNRGQVSERKINCPQTGARRLLSLLLLCRR